MYLYRCDRRCDHERGLLAITTMTYLFISKHLYTILLDVLHYWICISQKMLIIIDVNIYHQ